MTTNRLLGVALAAALAVPGCGYRVIGDRDFPAATAASGPRYTLLLPDLRVARTDRGPAIDCETRGDALFVHVRVENVGERAAPRFDTSVGVNRRQATTRTSAPLGPGQVASIGFLFTDISAAVGNVFTVTVAVDDPIAHAPAGEVFEHDETNNATTQACTVM